MKVVYIPAAGGMDFRPLSVLSVVTYRFLGRADHSPDVFFCLCLFTRVRY